MSSGQNTQRQRPRILGTAIRRVTGSSPVWGAYQKNTPLWCVFCFTYPKIHYTAMINYFPFEEMYCFGDNPIFFLNTFEK